MKRLKPRTAGSPEARTDFEPLVREAQEEETAVENKTFHGFSFEENDFSQTVFKGCIFERCRFTRCNLKKTEFMDVIFRTCDFSGSLLEGGYVSRC